MTDENLGVPAYPQLAEEYAAVRDGINALSLDTVDFIRKSSAEQTLNSTTALSIIGRLAHDPIHAAARLLQLSGASNEEIKRWLAECRKNLGDTVLRNDTSTATIEKEVMESARKVGVDVGKLFELPQAYAEADTKETVLAALGVRDENLANSRPATIIPGLTVEVSQGFNIPNGPTGFHVRFHFNNDSLAVANARRSTIADLRSITGTLKP